MSTCATVETIERTGHTDFEPLPVKSENVIQFPLGLLGFENIKRFALLENEQELPFRWLQVIDQPNLAFLVLPAAEFLPDYNPDASRGRAGVQHRHVARQRREHGESQGADRHQSFFVESKTGGAGQRRAVFRPTTFAAPCLKFFPRLPCSYSHAKQTKAS